MTAVAIIFAGYIIASVIEKGLEQIATAISNKDSKNADN